MVAPSHGPYFRREPAMINRSIDRLKGYLHLSDFGACAVDWPLMEQWEEDLLEVAFQVHDRGMTTGLLCKHGVQRVAICENVQKTREFGQSVHC